MKGHQIALGRLGSRDAAALVVDGRLEDLLVDPAGLQAFAPGAILRGRVNRLMKGQGGVFVSLPDGATGYLRDRSGLREGQNLLVQISGAAEPGKALPLTSRVLIRGRYGIATPTAPGVNISRSIRDPDRRAALQSLGQSVLAERETGLILRSACAEAEDAEIAAELSQIIDLATAISADAEGAPELLLDAPTPSETAWQDWSDPEPDAVEDADDMPEEIADRVDALLSPRMSLSGGAFALIEPTRALLAVDVNTGPDTSPKAALKANIALARDLPRQLRLRGLGGQIVIDFAPISKRERGTLEQELKKSFRGDGGDAVLLGWTAMGLFELTRKRDRVPLALLLEQG
ncbi:ribonuclease, Rne/Rng family [Paracoccus isoporae]|uniref:Ribonuclease, Rne/Rng family n=1 Tax=Paracoccus isoporae TaxID=591205 RepID=A0A1G6TIK4_9RHOB|nr:ribonuclease E/G [Paracoccus isoporae]SDD28356.1 ribonuclease, Rne/Rng family [Paracoccus isoporae]